ncbi:MAG TPA: sulfite exporter TauE/SafE family protein [Clostridia bacterium]|nr:sulfite exporter TauE/SafE family protein [Clostridia bacterium]
MADIKREILQMNGMTCSSCELRIEKAVGKLDGVKEVKAAYSASKVYVTFDADVIDINDIIAAIENEGYSVSQSTPASGKKEGKIERPKEHNGSSSGQTLGLIVILLSLYVVINNTVGFNFIPEVSQNMSYGILFVVGLLTSLHCVAMCGGINISQCIAYKHIDDGNPFSRLKPSFLYNLGRVISYTLIGGVVGALGSVVSFSGNAKGLVAVIAGIFMMIMGLNMLNVFPWLKKINPKMPKFIGKLLYNNSSKFGPFYIGLLNGLMPCGPLQAMQLYALGTGSFVTGAISMFSFSVGTVPLMFGFGAISTYLGKRFTNNMLKISAVLVIVLGIVMAARGFSLSGVSFALAAPNADKIAESGSVAQIEGNVQTVKIDLESNYYAPIVVQKGIPVRFIINAAEEDINGCNNAIIIPKYGIEKRLKPGENVIEFIPEEEGNVVYSCWMGMLRSNILVVSDIAKVSNDDIEKANEGIKGGGLVPPCCQ